MARVHTVPFREVVPVAIIAWSGALLEWVDFYMYAILAKILAKKFFPATDPLASLLASFAALAIGFLFRPLGALGFGKLGDQVGRKIAFLTAITTMMIATLGLAVLPSYETIGILGSIGVFILRILQGLALGGGYGAALTYLGEFVPDDKRGLITGFLFTTPAFGMGIAGNLASFFQGYFGVEAFHDYGWRWCFFVAGIIVFVVAVIIHLLYKDTPVFLALKQIRRVTSSPIKDLFTNKHYMWLFLLVWIGVIGAHGPVWYTNQLYVSYFMQHHGISVGMASKILAYATYAALWTYIFFGWVSDKIGRKPVLVFGIYANALTFPIIFHIMKGYVNPPDTTMLFILTAILTYFNGVGYSGAMSALVLEIFPSRIRTTAVGFTYNMGYGVFGGLTPFMITLLLKITGNLYLSIIIWSTIVPCIMGLLYVFKGWETKGTRLWEELSSGKFARPALTVSPKATLQEVMEKMVAEGQRVAVVAENGRYVGIVEERKIIKAIAEGMSLSTPVEKIAIKAEPSYEIERVIDGIALLDQYGVKSVAVVDENERVLGIMDPRYVFNEIAVLTAGTKKGFAERIHVSEFMKQPAITIEDKTTLLEAANLMVKHNIGFLPVLSSETLRPVGVISEKDLIGFLSKEENKNKPVKDFMKKNVITVTPQSTLKEALEKLVTNKIRHLPVVAEGKVVGVISAKDCFKLV